jgi:hypothetical protein
MCEDYPCCGHNLTTNRCDDTFDYEAFYAEKFSDADYDPYYDDDY